METEINQFMIYLHNIKKTSENTELSYRRDLMKVKNYMEEQGIENVKEITKNNLTSYVGYLQKNKFSAATISRNIASLKAFYHYLSKEGMVSEDISDALHAPKIEKKMPEILSTKEVVKLLEQPSGNSPKEIRDKAMLELLYATGIRVTELINLKLSDVDLQVGYIVCHDGGKERVIPFGNQAKGACETGGSGGRGRVYAGWKKNRKRIHCFGCFRGEGRIWGLCVPGFETVLQF